MNCSHVHCAPLQLAYSSRTQGNIVSQSQTSQILVPPVRQLTAEPPLMVFAGAIVPATRMSLLKLLPDHQARDQGVLAYASMKLNDASVCRFCF